MVYIIKERIIFIKAYKFKDNFYLKVDIGFKEARRVIYKIVFIKAYKFKDNFYLGADIDIETKRVIYRIVFIKARNNKKVDILVDYFL